MKRVGYFLYSLIMLLFSYRMVLAFYPLSSLQYLLLTAPWLLSLSSSEIEHMNDVHQLLIQLDVALIMFLIVFVALCVYFFKKNMLWTFLHRAHRVYIRSLLIIIPLFLLFFSFIFRWFHYLFFPQGNWLFSANSPLIVAYPFSFFIGMSMGILTVSGLLSFLLNYLSVLNKP